MDQQHTSLILPPSRRWTMVNVSAKLRNVLFPYLLSFFYRLKKTQPRIYRIGVKSTGMRIRLRLRITGKCDFPVVDTILLRRLGRYEPETSMVLQNELKPGNTVLELGAAEGYFSVQMSRYVGDKGRIYSFEPNREFYKDCIFNLEINGCRNAVVRNEGLGSRDEEFIDGNGNLFRTGSLTAFLDRLDRPLDFIFIDVDAKTGDNADARQEGQLIDVICRHYLNQASKPSIFLEYILNDASFVTIRDKLAGLGYSMAQVTKRHFLFKAPASG